MNPSVYRHHGRDRSSFAGAMVFASLRHDVNTVSPFFCDRIDCDWVVAVGIDFVVCFVSVPCGFRDRNLKI